jgi:hypothetical protein
MTSVEHPHHRHGEVISSSSSNLNLKKGTSRYGERHRDGGGVLHRQRLGIGCSALRLALFIFCPIVFVAWSRFPSYDYAVHWKNNHVGTYEELDQFSKLLDLPRLSLSTEDAFLYDTRPQLAIGTLTEEQLECVT